MKKQLFLITIIGLLSTHAGAMDKKDEKEHATHSGHSARSSRSQPLPQATANIGTAQHKVALDKKLDNEKQAQMIKMPKIPKDGLTFFDKTNLPAELQDIIINYCAHLQDEPAQTAETDSNATSLAMSPDGQNLVLKDKNKIVQFWTKDANNRWLEQPTHRINTHEDIWNHTMNPDYQSLSLVTRYFDNTVRFWLKDAHTGWHEQLDQRINTDSAVGHIAMSPDGQSLISTHNDYTVRFWVKGANNRYHELLHQRITTNSAILSLVISPDGQNLIIQYDNKTIKIYITQRQAMLNYDARQKRHCVIL